MLAGPGSITTVLIFAGHAQDFSHYVVLITSIFTTALLTFLILDRSALLLKVLGKTGVNIFTRLMGLLLAALAVQFVIVGIQDVLPTLVKGLNLH